MEIFEVNGKKYRFNACKGFLVDSSTELTETDLVKDFEAHKEAVFAVLETVGQKIFVEVVETSPEPKTKKGG